MATGTARIFAPLGGGPAHAPEFSDSVMHRVLAANTAETITVPGAASDPPYLALFASDVAFFANLSATASIPAADVTDGTASTYMPTQRLVPAAGSISVIAASAGFVQVEFYKTK